LSFPRKRESHKDPLKEYILEKYPSKLDLAVILLILNKTGKSYQYT